MCVRAMINTIINIINIIGFIRDIGLYRLI